MYFPNELARHCKMSVGQCISTAKCYDWCVRVTQVGATDSQQRSLLGKHSEYVVKRLLLGVCFLPWKKCTYFYFSCCLFVKQSL